MRPILWFAALAFGLIGQGALAQQPGAPQTPFPRADDPEPPASVSEDRDLSPDKPPKRSPAFTDDGKIAPFPEQTQRRQDNALDATRRSQQPGYSVGPGNIINRKTP